MQRFMLKSKIHRATVTHCELPYEGSCAIAEDLLDAANLAENEQVDIWNTNNGKRFATYAIRGERGSGMISLNGSAARRVQIGDLVIIATFALIDNSEVRAGNKATSRFRRREEPHQRTAQLHADARLAAPTRDKADHPRRGNCR
jgi:aspartate 1-decarboxylase